MRNYLFLLATAIASFSLCGCDSSGGNTAADVTVDEIAEYERLNNLAEGEAAAELAETTTAP
tara:strand:- start:8562 stop:8747 length:186 start_codon:yes stop_codon:yes gene_type:complete